ncbi:DUF6304 family protein [Elizabethkingia sp. HX WHF]|uniref:DUF6304 family protein n=1 Tax=Elizabethkingia TaxID=308865 RepID=UPI00099AA304|nr:MULTISPECIES: DUF6304 family protein [Elizabethkingia]ATL44969.1 hypothetical protein CQS02_17475 [Elizabethkingia miricola]MCL1636730.1 DUF6304 family protein [Elizabethkingia bruuniana]MDX8564057.1 DUF6304 family protein [Elizabethkingia sp. HX WHF]OPC18817.1 hypothetical protein BAY00_13485 [Elizabethkingia bruuniana]
MTERKKYNGTYTDHLGTTSVIVENDFKNLYTEIDGVKFSGSEFSDLSVGDKTKYTKQQLERFTWSKTPVYNSEIVREELCNCTFKILVPQLIIDKTTDSEFYSDLKIEYTLGNAESGGSIEDENITISLSIEGKIYKGSSDLIETALDEIHSQFGERYHFKNCYGCLYGDYNVYGQSSFGTMMCFAAQKEKYKKVTNKQEYMDLETDEATNVQEIYYCDQYEVRKSGAGYRG